MLLVVNTIDVLDFEELKRVYSSSLQKDGAAVRKWETPENQRLYAERVFFQYLHDVFFETPGAFYAIWLESGKYVSALRMEPYEDGMLVEGLETAPNCRGQGYASRLLKAVLYQMSHRVYSHVEKSNRSSLAVHYGCGFLPYKDSAVLLDGTVSSRICTLIWDAPKNSFTE